MPWTCPACRTIIEHFDDVPRAKIIYRCHVCRLELVGDPATGKMTLAPLPGEHEEHGHSKKTQAIPVSRSRKI